MKDLLFICKWDKCKENTWSGVPLNLMNALSNHFNVIDGAIELGFIQKVIAKLCSLRIMNGKIISLSYIFNPYYMWCLRRRAKKLISRYNGELILEIGDYYADSNKNHSISVYQDLNIDYILYLAKNLPETYNYCGHKYSLNVLTNRNKLQKDFYLNCDHIFTMGGWLKKFMNDDKAVCVGAGFNSNGKSISYNKKCGNKILFVGRDFYRKGGDLVVEAFIKAKKIKKDLELYIISNDINISHDGIFCVNEVPTSKLIDYYNLCDVFCMPSRFEAFGIVFAEALHYGLPCIAANRFSMCEMIEDGKSGILINEYNVDELAEAMITIFNRKDIFEYTKNNIKNIDEKYSWNEVASKMSMVLNSKE